MRERELHARLEVRPADARRRRERLDRAPHVLRLQRRHPLRDLLRPVIGLRGRPRRLATTCDNKQKPRQNRHFLKYLHGILNVYVLPA